MNEIKIRKCVDLTLHPLAETTPLMSRDQFDALKLDIEMKGQIDPVTLYRGKIVDGRHRWLILQELREESIKTIDLPNNTTLTELEGIVMSKEMRRHETAGQLAIRAYRLKTASGSQYTSFAKAATAIGANRKRVGEANKIVQLYQRPDILETLFQGNKFPIIRDGRVFETDSLGTILKWLQEFSDVPTGNNTKLKPRIELTTDEELLCTQYINMIGKESELVRKTLASRLYSSVCEAEEFTEKKTPTTFAENGVPE